MSRTRRDAQLIRGAYGDDPDAFEPRIQQIVERFFIDEDGLVIAAIKGSTLRRYTRADMKGVPLEKTLGADAGMPHKYKLLLMNYEETGMAHGDYLMAMLEKFKATGDKTAKRHARRAFATIRRLADTVAKTNPYGRGWWPKPYGGMKDLAEMFETSIDQTIKIVLALEQYDRLLATKAQRQWCRMQVRAVADWWTGHHFTTRYFGNCCWWDLHEACHSASALLYLVRQAMAWTPGRKPRRLREAWEHLLGNRRWVLLKTGGLNAHNLAIECVNRLRVLDPDHDRLWGRSRDVLIEHSISRTDLATGTGELPSLGRLHTGVRTACSAATVFGWTGRRRYAQVAWQLLRCFNCGEKFHQHDQQHKPTSHNRVSWWFDAISGHFYAAWLLAYWRLRNATCAGR